MTTGLEEKVDRKSWSRVSDMRFELGNDRAVKALIAETTFNPSIANLRTIVLLLDELGREREALFLLRSAVEGHSHFHELFVDAARVALRLGMYTEAAAYIKSSIASDEHNPETLGVAALAFVLSNNTAAALMAAERALGWDAGNLEAAAALSEALLREGRTSEAQRVTLECLRTRARKTLAAVTAGSTVLVEGFGEQPLRVSAFGQVLKSEGHSNLADVYREAGRLCSSIALDACDIATLRDAKGVKLVNTIADADLLQRPLVSGAKELERHDVDLVNPMSGILRTARDKAAAFAGDIADLVAPRCVSVSGRTPTDRAAKTRSLIAQGLLQFPVMVRPAGAHTGLVSIAHTADDLTASAFESRTGRNYLTEYVNCRGADGFWRKTRAVWIRGELLLEHHYVCDRDIVRSRPARAFAATHSDADREAARVLGDGPKQESKALDALAQKLGLDVVAFDYVNLPDGRTVLFEATSCIRFILRREAALEGRHVEPSILALQDRLLRLLTASD